MPLLQPHLTGPLIERGDNRFQIGGERLLAGDLLQTAAHFTHGLCPAAGGVRQQQHVQPHLAVILRHGDGGVHRRLTGGHRHGGGVADDDGALHQGAAGTGVGQLRELRQHLHHLAGTLAAGRHDHHVHVGVLGLHVLQDRLTRAEGAGHAEGAALCHRQERIHAAQLRYQRLIGPQALLIAADGLLHRPGEHHGQFLLLALLILQHRHGVPDVIHALFPDGL